MPIKEKSKNSVPFYGQNWDVERWQELGFKSKEDAQYWKESSCGILCFKMGADALLAQAGRDITPTIAELIQHGKGMGAYTHTRGWIHHGLVELATEYNLRAETAGDLDTHTLQQMLKEGALVIVSIKWAFETSHSLRDKLRAARDFGLGPLKTLKLLLRWKKFGGHLALVVGYDENGFLVHHPSMSDTYNWQAEHIPTAKFTAGFTGRGIIIYPVLS